MDDFHNLFCYKLNKLFNYVSRVSFTDYGGYGSCDLL